MARSAADASVFHAIADPTRRAVLDALRDGERTVSDLLRPFRMTPSAMSQHLAVLRRAGLVRQRKHGRQRVYRVEPAPLRAVADWIGEYDRFWTEKLDNLGRYLDQRKRQDHPVEPSVRVAEPPAEPPPATPPSPSTRIPARPSPRARKEPHA